MKKLIVFNSITMNSFTIIDTAKTSFEPKTKKSSFWVGKT